MMTATMPVLVALVLVFAPAVMLYYLPRWFPMHTAVWMLILEIVILALMIFPAPAIWGLECFGILFSK